MAYRIATNTCLNLARKAARRPQVIQALPAAAPVPTGSTEVTWLQPYPDKLLDGLPDGDPGPYAHDIDAVVSLLADDIRITMPPLPAIWQGQERAAGFLTEVAFRLVPEARFVETRANWQPALAVYIRDQANCLWRGSGLLVITLRGDQIVGLTRFESHALRPFGLPRILPDDDPPGTSSAHP